ncbi:MAG: hypothetical protein JWN21_2323 [Sphingomonas bacterium]|uniref:hypothetical protein n=1 Tax=Sphingomonas bacterium TaxID=1895847 RepID=UPI00261F8B2E|nr:hypothetical protein [Sphingomonas bacterium]MDB5696780.1 hypothetical protein [Sphingomonas bacterium]
MTAAYRLKGIGWLAALAVVVLGFYLVSSRVASERQKLDVLNRSIAAAERDIRALETEFDTRANLAQLERWNGDTLSLAAPTAAQFLHDDAALASFDPYAVGLPGVKVAALVVPAMALEAAPTPVEVTAATQAPALAPAPAPASAVIKVAALAPVRPVITDAAIRAVAPSGRDAPAIARLAQAARATAAVAKVRPQAVAMLDRQLLSDTTFGDIMSGARREAGRGR